MKQGKQGVYARYIKRILDVLLSGCALIVLSPVLLIVAVLVRTKLGSPVIFSQERPGKNEKIFKMYKFRSMTDARDENGELLPDEVRLTHFGKVLRSTSLDELPELWNIFKGDMSIVGPCWCATCPAITRSSITATMCAPASRAGRRSTAATRSRGRISSAWMSGTVSM